MIHIKDFKISPNLQLFSQNYGELVKHSTNCTAEIDNQIMFICQDGWISIGTYQDFINANSVKNHDFAQKYSVLPDNIR